MNTDTVLVSEVIDVILLHPFSISVLLVQAVWLL